ncbi:ribbon-helix-helix domain-containing protein [Haladaptatus sp. F3-133]|jgi:Arc/MetJ-type ribon-helix-helix transcriptional regulator|uniref:Ribbon-helix-helix domain-containing protein n=1 Tax=Halorutilus salinus TaxID=2487751 RepID=A0A9Q4C499_9EURY|nr:ribbon-helix-helix domain-containing protein [Halorutilus salinus]MCX2818684.1 ribbon-helix-helix domain-containing protein [Halorutilus salinus]
MTEKLKPVQARVPESVEDELDRLVESGRYASRSEAIREALRKLLAEESRGSLRELADRAGVSEEDMLEELDDVRNG